VAPRGELADRAVEHPRTDGSDEPGVLGDRYEVERSHRAEDRVMPTDERLETANRLVRQLDQGLVVHLELVALDRAA
jgi:hypothetical protein